MALELETIIMAEIGLGDSYSWSNGSSTCKYIREKASRLLPEAISKHNHANDKIWQANQNLCDLVTRAAMEADTEDYILTKTWMVASEVIRAHMVLYANPASDHDAIIEDAIKTIQDYYLPIRRSFYDVYRDFKDYNDYQNFIENTKRY